MGKGYWDDYPYPNPSIPIPATHVGMPANLVLPQFDSVQFWFCSGPEPKNRFQFRSRTLLVGFRRFQNGSEWF